MKSFPAGPLSPKTSSGSPLGPLPRGAAAILLAALATVGAPIAGAQAQKPAAAAPASPAAPPPAAPEARTAPGPKRPVAVTSVEPKAVRAGELVTIVGKGLDQGNVVLLGQTSPEIVEQKDDRLVFRAANDPGKREGFEATVFILTPGTAPLNTGLSVRVSRADAAAGKTVQAVGKKTYLGGTYAVSASLPSKNTLKLPNAGTLTITLNSPDGEVELRLTAAGQARPAIRATRSGTLSWVVSPSALAKEMGLPGPPETMTVTLYTDEENPINATLDIGTPGTRSDVRTAEKPVDYKMVRVGPTPAPTPRKK